MDTDHRPLPGLELDDPELDEMLPETGVGILSMSADGVPYGVPLSFGYDGDALYSVFLGATAALRKETYADQSDTASFAAIDVGPDGAWRSVIVSGPLDRIAPERWDDAREAMLDNAYQSDLLAEPERVGARRSGAVGSRRRAVTAVYRAVGVSPSPTVFITWSAAEAANPRATSSRSSSVSPDSRSSSSGVKPALTGRPAGGRTATVAWGPLLPYESSDPTAYPSGRYVWVRETMPATAVRSWRTCAVERSTSSGWPASTTPGAPAYGLFPFMK